ncbi:MAG: DUF2490 domain-containing protein [bacterium]|nr:DUF2490 domain-containing protein [bacterium]
MNLRNKGFLLFLIFQFGKAHSQSSYPINYTGWYGWDGYVAFKEGKPWGLMGEAYWIRDEVILKQNALFARLGINYYLKSGHRLNAGIAYQYNYPYDESSKPYNWPDYRLFQQFLMRFPKPKGMWQFRFRLEERWLGRKTDPTSSTFDHYQYETSLIIRAQKSFVIGPRFYAVVYDEIWLLFSTPDRPLDQNRAYVGLGTYLNSKKEWKLELGYMNQPNFTGSPDTDEKSRLNNALRITLISEAPFKR